MPKLTAKERAALAKQILAADDEDDEDEPETPAEAPDEDDDFVIYKGRKYRPEVAAEKKADDAETETEPEEKEPEKPRKRRFQT